MRVLLLKPPQTSQAILHIMPPLGLGYLAEAIRDHCDDLRILDCVCEGISREQLINLIREQKPDVVAMTMLSHDTHTIKWITDNIKNAVSAGIITIVGGPHPSAAPEHTLKYLDNVDFAFNGEGEQGFPHLINFLKQCDCDNTKNLRDIPGLVYRDNGAIQVNSQSLENDLDQYGFPAWDILDPRKYFKTCQGVFYRKKRFASIIATRGCPYGCAFCAGHTIMGKKIRKRSVAHIIEEIQYLQNAYGIEEFHFLDDNFTGDNDFVISFCNALIKQDINIAWTCPNGVRLDSLNEELLLKMQEAGCYSLFVGIESGSQSVLDKMNKGLKIEDIAAKITTIKRIGFETTGFFILGFPGETKEDMEQTIQFALSLPLDVADFSNFLPLPGSTIFHQIYGQNAEDKVNYERLSTPAHVSNKTTEDSNKSMQRHMIRLAYLRFYCRWRTLTNLLSKIRNIHQVSFILKRVYTYILAN